MQISSSADNANAAAQAPNISNEVSTEPGPNGHIPESEGDSRVNRTDLAQEDANQIEGILHIRIGKYKKVRPEAESF